MYAYNPEIGEADRFERLADAGWTPVGAPFGSEPRDRDPEVADCDLEDALWKWRAHEAEQDLAERGLAGSNADLGYEV